MEWIRKHRITSIGIAVAVVLFVLNIAIPSQTSRSTYDPETDPTLGYLEENANTSNTEEVAENENIPQTSNETDISSDQEMIQSKRGSLVINEYNEKYPDDAITQEQVTDILSGAGYITEVDLGLVRFTFSLSDGSDFYIVAVDSPTTTQATERQIEIAARFVSLIYHIDVKEAEELLRPIIENKADLEEIDLGGRKPVWFSTAEDSIKGTYELHFYESPM